MPLNLTLLFNKYNKKMKLRFNLLIATMLLLTFSSCSTIFCGTKKKITLQSNVEKAEYIEVDGRRYDSVTFPYVVKVDRGFNASVIKGVTEDNKTATVYVDKKFNAVSIINLIDVLGWGIDAATGAIMKPEFKGYTLQFPTNK